MDPALRVRLTVGGLAMLVVFLRSAAGRFAPRAAFAPVVFLATRWPVLIGWSVGTVGVAAALTSSLIRNGRDPSDSLGMLAGVSLLCGLGFALLAVGPAFLLMRALARAPELGLEPGETVLRELDANHFLNGEARGGKLLLTSARMAFRPHRFNVQLDTWSLPWTGLVGATAEGTRLLVVQTRGAGTEWLVVWHPSELIAGLRARGRLA